jgi:hypothetical protein
MDNSIFNFPYSWRRWSGIEKNIRHIPRMFKYAWQRMNRGYADCDVWNFDTYLVSIITAGLRYLAKHGHTYAHDFTPEEWEDWLRKTADMLEEGADNDWWINWDNFGESYQKECIRRKVLFNEAFDRLKEHFGDLWD